ncbi:methyltransferase domain-containing protein [archaeon]|jgi:hypothetical protein|nr:methyltransferase domain-containing protein [archaeon]MBT3451716.1 methyltransferase domain-containing protein [archaeon]MBT6869804.1 methyltransferase domain-containing protein [archaeon]MBT7192759.1 methyltransferase domain-containing protein [archaeon]MBT7380784.1 methyltransferase domain-containing protein [archaeon]
MHDEILANRRRQLEEQQTADPQSNNKLTSKPVRTMEEILANPSQTQNVGLSNDQVLQLINRGPELVGLYNQILRQAAIKNPLAQNSLDSLNSVLQESGYDVEEIAVMKFIYAYELAYGQLGPVEMEPKGWLQTIYWNRRKLAEVQSQEKVELARVEAETELERERYNLTLRVEAEARSLVLDKELEVSKVQAEADREKYQVERLQLERENESTRKDNEKRSKFKEDLIAHLISLENSVWLKFYVQACRDLEYAVPEKALKGYVSALFDENDNIDFLPVHKPGKNNYHSNYSQFLFEVSPILKTKRDNLENAMDRVFMRVHNHIYNKLKDDCSDVSDITLVQSGYIGRNDFGSDVNQIKFVGIDICEESIDFAKGEYTRYDFDKKEFFPRPNYKFICGDARNLGDHVEGAIDVIFTSHPEVLHNNQVWIDIYFNSARKHKKGGLLVSTFYMVEELDMAKLILGGDYDIEVACENPFTRNVGGSTELYPHKYVLVAKKK